jgi:DNA-binding transcriptional MerR regulator
MTQINDILERRRNLCAKLPEFAAVASEAIEALALEREGGRGRPPASEGVSERVIRDYVRRSVLRPTQTRDGERGLYDFRHLLELLATRVLLNDGWPLEKIAERNRAASVEELIAILPGAKSDPLALARQFRRQAEPVAKNSSSAATPFLDPVAAAAKLRAELPSFMRRFTGSSSPPTVRRLVSIDLGEAASVQIDPDRLRQMTIEDAEALGRAVTAAIITQGIKGR